MDEIVNYHQLSELIATSGQPTPEQFSQIAAAGYRLVINLALTTSSNAIAHEDSIVLAQGMRYLHFPVSWEKPTVADFVCFVGLLSSLKTEKIWLHCAKNMRVSCFIYLYKKHILQLSESQAHQPMSLIWQPDGAWAQLITDVDQYYTSL